MQHLIEKYYSIPSAERSQEGGFQGGGRAHVSPRLSGACAGACACTHESVGAHVWPACACTSTRLAVPGCVRVCGYVWGQGKFLCFCYKMRTFLLLPEVALLSIKGQLNKNPGYFLFPRGTWSTWALGKCRSLVPAAMESHRGNHTPGPQPPLGSQGTDGHSCPRRPHHRQLQDKASGHHPTAPR